MNVHHAVIHQLFKEEGSESEIRLADASLDVSQEALIGLVSSVHQVYGSRAGKRYCEFDPAITQFSIEPHLTVFKAGGAEFFLVSGQIMNVLKHHADSQNFAHGGYVLIFDYTESGKRWFVIAVVRSAPGTMVDEHFKVIKAPHLDTDGIRFAGRIDFEGWEAGGERYVSFLRGKTTDIAQYFQKVLGCSNVSSDLQDTKALVEAAKKFSTDQGLDSATKEAFLTAINNHAKSRAEAGEALYLDLLANEVWPEDPDALKQAFADSDPPISDGFVPHKRGLRPLVRFKTGSPKWALEFDRDVLGETILFNPDEQSLTIRDLPAEVLAKLQEEFSENGNN